MVYGFVGDSREGGMLLRVDACAFVVWEAFIKGGHVLGPSNAISMDVRKTITLLQQEEKAPARREADGKPPALPLREGANDSRTDIRNGRSIGSEVVSLKTIPV